MRRPVLYAVGSGAVLLALVWLARLPRSGAELQTVPLDAASSKARTASEKQRGPVSVPGRDQVSAAQRIRSRLLSSPLPENIRPEILRLATNTATGPGLKEFSTADLETLKRLYVGQTNLVARRPLTLALGFIGDEEVVELFKHALTVEHQGKQPEMRWEAGVAGGVANEMIVMFATVHMLGFLADKHEAAYSFLEAGIQREFWEENSRFASAEVKDMPSILAGEAIHALGISGRPEVPALLEQLKVQPSLAPEGRRALYGPVVTAAFAYYMVSQHGQDYYKTIYGTETLFGVFSQWKQSDKGQPWSEWSRAQRGLPPLEPKPIQNQP